MIKVVTFVCVLAVAVTSLAVKPVTWTHSTEANFSAGELSKTVVTSLGEVKLARALETLVKPAKKTGMISTIAIAWRGEVYVAAAPQATVYRLENDKLVKFAKLPGVLVRSMTYSGGKLIAGTCGKEAGLYRIDRKGKVKKIWTDKKVASVWSVLPGRRGSFYVATGAEGKVYHVKSNGKATVVYDSDEKNILSLTAAARGGLLYAGTGEKGLIIEIDPAKKKGRILYDAKETEISCLIVDADGVLYAATSDSSKASADGEAPSGEIKGKPDKTTPTRPARKPASKPAIKTTAPTRPAAPKVVKPPVKPVKEKKAVPVLPAPTTGPADNKSVFPMTISTMPGEDLKRLIKKRVIRYRLVGKPPAETKKAPARRQVPPEIMKRIAAARRAASARRPTPTKPPSGKGNAVYRIDREGFVRPIFRRPVTILSMTMLDGALMLGTGHGGQVFTVDTDGEQICAVVKLDPKDVTALTADTKGRLYIGTAGTGGLFALGKGFAKKGTLISKVFEAAQIARWGTMSVRADIPPGCAITIATRSGNVAKPDKKTWSDWSVETMVVGTGWFPIASPAGRFLQYRLTLASDGKASAAIDRVALVHQVGNLAPAISSVAVAVSSKPSPGKASGSPKRFRIIQAKAADPNGDAMQYEMHFRRVGRQKWIKLIEKSAKPMYAWDTRAVPDGTYEVRVKASDSPANPPSSALTASRISRLIIVDNSRPKVTDLAVKKLGKGKVSLTGKATDALSRIRRIDYAVDTNEKWIRLQADDGICDSQKETFKTTITDLEDGAHRIAVRVVDEYYNVAYSSVEVTIGK